MKTDPLAKHLLRVKNLRAFSQASKIPRRTLYTVMREANEPRPETRALIERKLAELQPALRAKPRQLPPLVLKEAA